MRLESRDDSGVALLLSTGERDVIRTCLHQDPSDGRRPAVLSRRTPDRMPSAAAADLAAALAARRREALEAARGWLAEAGRWEPAGDDLLRWRLGIDEADTLLRIVNQLRMAAWERLGCPDFEHGEVPAIDETTLPSLWMLQVTDRLLGVLIAAVAPEE